MDMKQIRLFATLLMVALMATSCITWVNEDDNNNSSSGGSNNLKTGQIKIKVYANNNRVSFSATTEKITIDWGDGKIDQLTPNGVNQIFSHTYPNSSLQTIYIESEKLVKFGGLSYYNDVSGTFKELYFGEMNGLEIFDACCSGLTVLEIKKANSLKEIFCSSNQLSSLNVSGLTSLRFLDCGSNQLTSNALNSLFESLPNRPAKDGGICFDGNPGSKGCNEAIAQNKGWNYVIPIAVESVTLNAPTSQIPLNVGATLRLTATVLPADAYNPSVKWTSSNPSVAKVEEGGGLMGEVAIVIALAPGQTTISVKTVEGGFTATCTLTVK